MNTIQQKFNSVINRISENETIRTELFREKYALERAHFDEIYVGKFWLKESNDDLIYSYWKGCIIDDPLINNSGIFDCFTFNGDGNKTSFNKDYLTHSMLPFCKEEITEKEYSEALERFKNKFFEFIRIERKVLIEKT